MKSFSLFIFILIILNCKYYDPNLFEDTYIEQKAKNLKFDISKLPIVDTDTEEDLVLKYKIWPTHRLTFFKPIREKINNKSFEFDKILIFSYSKYVEIQTERTGIFGYPEIIKLHILLGKGKVKEYFITHRVRDIDTNDPFKNGKYHTHFNKKTTENEDLYGYENGEVNVNCYIAQSRNQEDKLRIPCPYWNPVTKASGFWEKFRDVVLVFFLRIRYFFFPPLPPV